MARTGRFLALAAMACLLTATAPGPLAALTTVRTAASAGDPLAPLLALVALLAELVAGWLLLACAVTAAGRLPGRVGAGMTAVAGRIAPAVVRRLLQALLGISVATGVLTAGPASASPAVPPAPPAPAAALDWPTAERPADGSAPSLDWNPSVDVAPPAPGRVATAPVAVAAGPQAAEAAVVVRPGDSLWAVARRHLPTDADDARIAAAWPSWWAANRDAIGADPDLIHPGLRLTPPADA